MDFVGNVSYYLWLLIIVVRRQLDIIEQHPTLPGNGFLLGH